MITSKFKALVLKSGDEYVRIPAEVELAWDYENDPLAVQMITSVGDEPDVVWFVSLDLFKRGVNSLIAIGNGNIRFRYSGTANGQDSLYVCLRSSNGHADLGLPHHEVVSFLNETSDVGEDCLTGLIDEAIEDILNG